MLIYHLVNHQFPSFDDLAAPYTLLEQIECYCNMGTVPKVRNYSISVRLRICIPGKFFTLHFTGIISSA